MIKSELVQHIADVQPASLSARRREHRQRHPQRDRRGDGARRPGRAARLRRLLGEEPAGPHRPQSAHRRACLGRAEVRAVLQDRQGNARAAEQDARRRRRAAPLSAFRRSGCSRRSSGCKTSVPCASSSPLPFSFRSPIVIVMFAVANRETITVSFDPFDSAHPAFALKMPLFMLIFVLVGARRRGRRHRRLAEAAQVADAGAAGRSRGARSARAGSTPSSRAATCRPRWRHRRRSSCRRRRDAPCASSPPTRSIAC